MLLQPYRSRPSILRWPAHAWAVLILLACCLPACAGSGLAAPTPTAAPSLTTAPSATPTVTLTPTPPPTATPSPTPTVTPTLTPTLSPRAITAVTADRLEPVLVLEGHRGYVFGVAVSANGQLIASACGDRLVRVFDGESGELLHTLERHRSLVYTVAFSGWYAADLRWP